MPKATPRLHLPRTLLRSNLAFEDDDIQYYDETLGFHVGYRRPELESVKEPELSDSVRLRLFLARVRAIERYHEVWGWTSPHFCGLFLVYKYGHDWMDADRAVVRGQSRVRSLGRIPTPCQLSGHARKIGHTLSTKETAHRNPNSLSTCDGCATRTQS